MAPRLSPSRLAFYKQFLGQFPRGLAVLRRQRLRGAASAWVLVAANPQAYRAAGNAPDAFVNIPLVEHEPQGAARRLAEIYFDVAETHRSRFLGHIRGHGSDGSYLALMASAHFLEPDVIAVLFEDVSALNQVTRKLLETEALLAQSCQAAQVIVWRAEPGTLKFTRVTKEAREILGYWLERWHNESDFWRRHAHPLDWSVARNACARAAAGEGEQRFDCRMIRADGAIRWFRFCVSKVALLAGREELVGVMLDVTDHKRVELAARRLSGQIIHAQEMERRRISRDLHDSLGQHLTGVKCLLTSALSSGTRTPQLRQKLRECVDTLRICIEETRSISQMLHPPILDLLGLAAALRSLAESFTSRTGIRVDLDLPLVDARHDPAVETALFRIAQECLTNVQRHSKSASARIRLASYSADILLEIADRGVGLDPRVADPLNRVKAGQGIGLLKIRERVSELNGSFTIRSQGGVTVSVCIHLQFSVAEPLRDTAAAGRTSS